MSDERMRIGKNAAISMGLFFGSFTSVMLIKSDLQWFCLFIATIAFIVSIFAGRKLQQLAEINLNSDGTCAIFIMHYLVGSLSLIMLLSHIFSDLFITSAFFYSLCGTIVYAAKVVILNERERDEAQELWEQRRRLAYDVERRNSSIYTCSIVTTDTTDE